MKISVALDCRGLEWTGVGTYLKNLIPVLSESKEIRLVCLGKLDVLKKFPWTERVQNIRIDSNIFSLGEQVELLLRAPKCDLLWIPHFNIPLLYRGKMLVTVHDARVVAMPQHINRFQRLYSKLMFSGIKHKADAVISVSEFTKNELIRVVGIDEKRIHTIYNGVSVTQTNFTNKTPTPKKPFILYVGNVKPHKNLHNLVSAFELLSNSIPHDLVVVGEKGDLRNIDRLAFKKAECIGNRVIFAGRISDDELNKYYSTADVLVFPSLYEGFGFPALEAMARGCPAIVSRGSSLPEVCGDAALYFDPYDPKDIAAKIELLLGKKALRESLVDKGIEQVRRYVWSDAARKTLHVIRSLMG